MARSVVFSNQFEPDVRKAAAWFEAQSAGLGNQFIEAVDVEIDRIVDHPLAYREVRSSIHRSVIRRFRYLLFFRVREDSLQFLGVIHGTRDWESWLDLRARG